MLPKSSGDGGNITREIALGVEVVLCDGQVDDGLEALGDFCRDSDELNPKSYFNMLITIPAGIVHVRIVVSALPDLSFGLHRA